MQGMGGVAHRRYQEVWPDILTRHAVRLPELNEMVADLKRQGILESANWDARQRVPRGDTELRLASPAIADAR